MSQDMQGDFFVFPGLGGQGHDEFDFTRDLRSAFRQHICIYSRNSTQVQQKAYEYAYLLEDNEDR